MQHAFFVIVRRAVAGDGLHRRGGVGHGETEAGMLQHFDIVAAIAKRHHFMVLDAPALLQDAQSVGFMHAGNNQVNAAVAGSDRGHHIAKCGVQLRLYLRDQLVRHVEAELQNCIISNMIKVVDQFEAMIILRRDRFQLIIILVEGISAALAAGDDFNVGQRLEMVDNSIEMLLRHPAVKYIFSGADHPAAVFGDKGDLMRYLREEGDKLVILVAAGNDEADACSRIR